MKSVHGHFVILRNIARRTNASPGLSREQSGSIQYGYLHILIGINSCSVTPSNDQQSSVAIAWKITITHKEHYSGLFANLHITVAYAQYEDTRPHSETPNSTGKKNLFTKKVF